MKPVILYIIVLLVLPAVAGCHRTPLTDTTSPDIILNDIWVLETLHGEPVGNNDFGRERPRLEFNRESMRVTGTTGCNSLTGKYTARKDVISFGAMITTKMACEGTGEATFLKTLESVNRFSIRDLKLYLAEGNTVKAVFRKVD